MIWNFHIKNQQNGSLAFFLKMKCDTDGRWKTNRVEDTMNSGKGSLWSELGFALLRLMNN